MKYFLFVLVVVFGACTNKTDSIENLQVAQNQMLNCNQIAKELSVKNFQFSLGDRSCALKVTEYTTIWLEGPDLQGALRGISLKAEVENRLSRVPCYKTCDVKFKDNDRRAFKDCQFDCYIKFEAKIRK